MFSRSHFDKAMLMPKVIWSGLYNAALSFAAAPMRLVGGSKGEK